MLWAPAVAAAAIRTTAPATALAKNFILTPMGCRILGNRGSEGKLRALPRHKLALHFAATIFLRYASTNCVRVSFSRPVEAVRAAAAVSPASNWQTAR